MLELKLKLLSASQDVAPWLPSDADMLRLWFDAADPATITHAQNRVSAWADKSGMDYHAEQSNTSKQPLQGKVDINALNAIQFQANDLMRLATGPSAHGTNPMAMFAVIHTVADGENRPVFWAAGSSSGALTLRVGPGNIVEMYRGSTVVEGPATLVSGYNIIAGISAGGEDWCELNGEEGARVTAGSLSELITPCIGANNNESAFLNSWLGELLFFHEYSVDLRNRVYFYLAKKWGHPG